MSKPADVLIIGAGPSGGVAAFADRPASVGAALGGVVLRRIGRPRWPNLRSRALALGSVVGAQSWELSRGGSVVGAQSSELELLSLELLDEDDLLEEPE